jgi:hypothetical protein
MRTFLNIDGHGGGIYQNRMANKEFQFYENLHVVLIKI